MLKSTDGSPNGHDVLEEESKELLSETDRYEVMLNEKQVKNKERESKRNKVGVQAGVYTNNWNRVHYAFDHIEAGGVCMTPSVRIDSHACIFISLSINMLLCLVQCMFLSSLSLFSFPCAPNITLQFADGGMVMKDAGKI